MSKFEETVRSIQKELTNNKGLSREVFLAECARRRIQDRNHKYEEYFDRYLRMTEEIETDSLDISRTCTTLRVLSKLVSQSYEGLIEMADYYDKNIFSTKD